MREDSISVQTPEQVSVQFQLAGIGTRAIAHLVDVLILMVIYVLATIGAIAWDWTHVFGNALPYVIGFLILTGFLLLWAYFIMFESIWAGRTPGKRLVRVRTISLDGRPASFFAIVVRNLLRLVDFLPTGYFLGVIVMLIDNRERRIGDLAAGTVVVLDNRRPALPPLTGTGATAALDMTDIDSLPRYVVTTKYPKYHHSLIIRGSLPVVDETLVQTFHQREKGMSRSAREQLIERVWSQLLLTGVVDVVDKASAHLGTDTDSSSTTSADISVDEKAALLVAVARSRRKRQFGVWQP